MRLMLSSGASYVVICFLQAEVDNAAELHRRMTQVYGIKLFLCDGVVRQRFWKTKQLPEQFKWDVFDNPPYSPDSAPCDFHLFPELKNWLWYKSFQTNGELQANVQAHLTSLVATFFEELIGKLVCRYAKCLNLHNDYVEK